MKQLRRKKGKEVETKHDTDSDLKAMGYSGKKDQHRPEQAVNCSEKSILWIHVGLSLNPTTY